MKQIMFLLSVVSILILTGCGNDLSDNEPVVSITSKQETVVFHCANIKLITEEMAKANAMVSPGDGLYSKKLLTRSGIEADGIAMTDLWIFDYVDGNLKQTIHQTTSDSDFGSPTLKLDYGTHIIRFVASRGQAPTLSSGNIEWTKASDTFVAELTLSVASGMQTEQAVLLERIATRLKLFVSDTFPPNASTLELNASMWYTSLSVPSLNATNSTAVNYTFDIKSLAGKKGVTFTTFSLCPSQNTWNTNVALIVKDDTGKVITSINIPNIELKSNRTTVLSGDLFGKNNKMTVSLNSKWSEDYVQNF